MSKINFYWFNQKSWWRNIGNYIIYYQHISEDYALRFDHMNKKCRFDRTGDYSKCWRGK